MSAEALKLVLNKSQRSKDYISLMITSFSKAAGKGFNFLNFSWHYAILQNIFS